jgi:lysozyme
MSQPKKISDAGIALLVEFEGEILRVYNDPVGLPTFGVGHLVTAAEKKDYPVGKKITKATSRAFLRRDVERFEDCINSSVKVPITQNQFDALLSLAFNIGETNFKRSSVLRNLNKRQFDKAADAFTAWNKAKKNGKKIVLPGLTRRRNAERSVFLSPDDPNSATATASIESDANRTTTNDQPLDSSLVPAEQPLPTPVVVEKEKEKGFFEGIKLTVAGWWATIGGMEGARQVSGDATAFGISGGDILQKVIIALIAAFVLWICYRGLKHIAAGIKSRILTAALVNANGTPGQVIVAEADKLAELEANGWVAVRRK